VEKEHIYNDIAQFYFSVSNNEILGKLFQTLRYINSKLLTCSVSNAKKYAPEEYADDSYQFDALL
jgi:hypothetical protein